ncbi:hypothetical protein CCR75_006763 [Bremia lactucae]|uniref:Uncharacterized protein n=1 Tax=Bremia lactucae TaxID=4779 RepID=A0A976FG07_BRELC|nr:hypothetical protein CCR75_006763 [Bremia lactucae]
MSQTPAQLLDRQPHSHRLPGLGLLQSCNPSAEYVLPRTQHARGTRTSTVNIKDSSISFGTAQGQLRHGRRLSRSGRDQQYQQLNYSRINKQRYRDRYMICLLKSMHKQKSASTEQEAAKVKQVLLRQLRTVAIKEQRKIAMLAKVSTSA